jgi:peptidoglycan/LPS O-acetylase OafA/YrhL
MMMTIEFTLYLIACLFILRKKRKLAFVTVLIAFLFAIFIFKFHATTVLNIRL